MPAEPDPARARFLIINLVRMAGVIALLGGVAVLADAWALPDTAGVVLVMIGAVGTFLAPTLLARRWSSNRR